MELENAEMEATGTLADRVYSDPIGYLGSLGIEAVLVGQTESRLPEAA